VLSLSLTDILIVRVIAIDNAGDAVILLPAFAGGFSPSGDPDAPY
jgi:hypothetical protein